jgi:general secretion pathway protein C
MKSHFKYFDLRFVVFLAGIFLFIKFLWFGVERMWLAPGGYDYVPDSKVKPLHYTTRFASGKQALKPPPKKPVATLQSMKNFTLLSVYHSPSEDIVTVKYKGKTHILARGESVEGFSLVSAGVNFAIFDKNGKTYKLLLTDTNEEDVRDFTRKRSAATPRPKTSDENKTASDEVRVVDETHRIVSKETLTRYMSDMDAIGKNIGIREVRKNGKINGFAVTYIKHGSVFSKLGLKRGDTIVAVNGEPLDSYKSAFEAYKSAAEAVDMTLTIKRGNQTMELEYEVD